MSQFDANKWLKNQYLKEAGLYESVADQVAKAIDDAITSIDDSLSYKDFALAVAKILKDEYGSHLIQPFMDILHAQLNLDEALNESENSLIDDFKEEFDVRAYGDSDTINIFQKGDIYDDTFEKMIKFIEDRGYTVDREQSHAWYDNEPGERDFFPRIRFSK